MTKTEGKRFEITPDVFRAGVAAWEAWDNEREAPETLVAAILFACEQPLLANLVPAEPWPLTRSPLVISSDR